LVYSALGRIGGTESEDALLKGLDDENDLCVMAAAHSLGLINSKKAHEPLIQLLGDKSPSVRVEAVFGLGAIGDPSSASAIRPLLSDAAWEVEVAAVKALGMLRDTSSIDALASVMLHDYWDIRVEALKALGFIGASKTLSICERYFDDKHPGVRIWSRLSALKAGSEPGKTLNTIKKENPSTDVIDVAECLAGKKPSPDDWQGYLNNERLDLLILLHNSESRELLERLTVPVENQELNERKMIALRQW
jgi:HEAT repeat protein